jgi:tetratricopeptide (TPR) repeat protein
MTRLNLPVSWLPAALAAALWFQAIPAVAAPPSLSRAEALAALRNPEVAQRRLGAHSLAATGKFEDAPALIAALRDSDSQVRAIAEEAVWAVWSRSGDPRVDELFRRGVAQMSGGQLRDAIDTFAEVIRLKPDFAEGWNKRATAYFLAGDYRRSLRDCDEVIKRNPQHFGALSGYGQIYLRLEEPEKAIGYLRRALAIDPNLEGVRITIRNLESLIARRRGQSI